MCERLYIYPADLQIITGKSERHCREFHATIRAALNKKKYITITEYCQYTGDNVGEISTFLDKKKEKK